jgi:hypothetical protein
MKKILLLLLFPHLLLSQGGMWMPIYLEKLNEKEMQGMGLRLSADDVYNVNNPSLKDAICMFGGGCTGSIISPEGLLLTNHHCGFGAIQRLSSVEKNYVDNGFWAASRSEELPCPGITAMFVSRMEDVTTPALTGVTDAMSERERQSQIDKNLEQVRASAKKEAWESVSTRPFYDGNQYFLFVTVTYQDVRLVGAPPSSIGKFGADTDNWVWPRHTGDFALFRVYAGKDNKPAAYSPDNQPLQPKQYLSVSIDGVEEGDFTMVYGFPGRTTEYLSAAAVQQTGEVLNPARVSVRDRALKIMDGFMRQDLDIKIAYVAKYASIANAWKKWLGEMQGLKTYGALEKKRNLEAEFTRRIQQNIDLNYRYGNLLPRLNTLHQEIDPYALARDYYLEVFVRNSEIMGLAARMDKWLKSYNAENTPAFSKGIAEQRGALESYFKDYRPVVDQSVLAGLMELYAEKTQDDWGASILKENSKKHNGYPGLAAYLFSNSALADKDKMLSLLGKEPAVIAETLNNDPAVLLWRRVTEVYQTKVEPTYNELQPQINLLQRQYMAAQMAVFKEKRFFPDANGTLRLTYGQVRGYAPRDAVIYDFRTYLDGVIEKYVPGDYEFDVPEKLIDLYQNKDYGPYADKTGRMPLAFLGSNHTTGGNSGSPALNASGHLIGLNFDRVWEGTMSDLNYDPAICRNIMVDICYVLFVVDKFAGAQHLIKEMNLVHSKQTKQAKKRRHASK